MKKSIGHTYMGLYKLFVHHHEGAILINTDRDFFFLLVMQQRPEKQLLHRSNPCGVHSVSTYYL